MLCEKNWSASSRIVVLGEREQETSRAGLGHRPLWLSAYSFAKIRNRERGRKWAKQQDIDKEEGGGPGRGALPLPRGSPVREGFLSFQNQFRLGIRFDVYPEKRWSNNTIAYQISSEYGKCSMLYVLALRRASRAIPKAFSVAGQNPMFNTSDIHTTRRNISECLERSFFPCRAPRAIAHPIRAEDVPIHELPPLRRVGRTIRGLPLHPLLQRETGVSKSVRR